MHAIQLALVTLVALVAADDTSHPLHPGTGEFVCVVVATPSILLL
jgi:hypothetical protein